MSWLVKPCSSVEEHVKHEPSITIHTWLAQSVERQPFKLVVEGSSPSSGVFLLIIINYNTNKYFIVKILKDIYILYYVKDTL